MGDTITRPINVGGGTLQGRQIPEEPLYIILNVDISKRWDWPYCDEAKLPPGGSCCVDCRDPKCTNYQPHLVTLCKDLEDPEEPAYYDIDYVRIWQRKNKSNLGCSPIAMPTEGWIESHKARYNSPVASEPWKQVFAGGHT